MTLLLSNERISGHHISCTRLKPTVFDQSDGIRNIQ